MRKYELHVQQHGEKHPDSVRVKAAKENMEKNIKQKVIR